MGPQADPYVERVATTNAQYANNAMEEPLTRAEVYQSLSSCYEECGKQVQVVAEQVTVNNVMVGQLAGRIAAAENLMTHHVAKLEKRVQVLGSTLEQELRNPGAIASAIDQLRILKDELAGMRQLMDEHPLHVAQRLQALEQKSEESVKAAREEVAGLRRWICEDVVPKLRAEMQVVATAVGEEVARRLATCEERTLQTAASEVRRLKADMEAAVVSLANHTAGIIHRQGSVEEMVSRQTAALFAQGLCPQRPNTVPSTQRAAVETEVRSTSRNRTRSRSADVPATSSMRSPSTLASVRQAPMTAPAEDMETKVANALILAMQRMGFVTQATPVHLTSSMQPQVMQPVAMPIPTLGTAIPRIDRSRQRGGRPVVGAATLPVLYGAAGHTHQPAAIHQVQVAPVGATAPSPNMMVTMTMQLSAALHNGSAETNTIGQNGGGGG